MLRDNAEAFISLYILHTYYGRVSLKYDVGSLAKYERVSAMPLPNQAASSSAAETFHSALRAIKPQLFLVLKIQRIVPCKRHHELI